MPSYYTPIKNKLQDPNHDQKFNREYRGVVVDNRDPLKYGRVKIFVPDIMSEEDKDDPMWFLPGNQIIGGQNDGTENPFFNSQFIPSIGSWWIVKFEEGNPENGYYIRPLQLMNTVLAPEFQTGKNPNLKSGFRFKNGQVIIISDDDEKEVNDNNKDEESYMLEEDKRVEITGIKRIIDEVYQILGNQKTILIDERKNREKILIEDQKGNSIMISTQTDNIMITANKNIIIQNYDEDISIMANNGNLNFLQKDNVNIYQGKDINLFSKEGDMNINLKEGSYNSQVNKDYNFKNKDANGNFNISIQKDITQKSFNGSINIEQLKDISSKTITGDIINKQMNISNKQDVNYSLQQLQINNKQEMNLNNEQRLNLNNKQGMSLNFGGNVTNITQISSLNIKSMLAPLTVVGSITGEGLVSPAGPVTGTLAGTLMVESITSGQQDPQPQEISIKNQPDIPEIQDLELDLQFPTFAPLGKYGNDQDRNYPRVYGVDYQDKTVNVQEYITNLDYDLPLNKKVANGRKIQEPKTTFKTSKIVSENNNKNYIEDFKKNEYKELRNKYNKVNNNGIKQL